MMKKLLPFFILLYSVSVFAQKSGSLIPKDLMAAVKIDFKRLDKKSNFQHNKRNIGLIGADFGLAAGVRQLFSLEGNSFPTAIMDPYNYGVDVNQPLYIGIGEQDSSTFLYVNASLEDPDIFEALAWKVFIDQATELKTINGYNYLTGEYESLIWNEKSFCIIRLLDEIAFQNKYEAEAWEEEATAEEAVEEESFNYDMYFEIREEIGLAGLSTDEQMTKLKGFFKIKQTEELSEEYMKTLISIGEQYQSAYGFDEELADDIDKMQKRLEGDASEEVEVVETEDPDYKPLMEKIASTISKGQSVFSSSDGFKKMNSKKAEFATWFNGNTKTIELILNNTFGRYFGFADMSDKIKEFVSPAYNYSTVSWLNYEKGETILTSEQTVADGFVKKIGPLYDNKLDKGSLKYLNGKNLMGYASLSIRSGQIVPVLRSFTEKIVDKMLSAREKEEYDHVLKEIDKNLSMFDGNVIIAMSDLKPVKIKYTDYEYGMNDEGDYEYQEVEVEQMIQRPGFHMVLDLKPGKRSAVEELLGKMGKNINGMYEIPLPMGMGMSMSAIVNNEKLILSNQSEIIEKYGFEGLPKERQVTAKEAKLALSNNASLYIDIQKTLRLIDFNSNDYKGILSYSQLFGSNFAGKLSISSKKKGSNKYVSTISLTHPDAKINSLEYYLSRIEDFTIVMRVISGLRLF